MVVVFRLRLYLGGSDKAMTEQEIFENLCYYDPRTPDCDPEADGRTPRPPGCMCDNCFYGRDELAMALLSGTRTTAWVTQVGHCVGGPYYAKAPFCGGTYDILEAERHETKSAAESLVGVPVEVIVVTKVEIVTDGN